MKADYQSTFILVEEKLDHKRDNLNAELRLEVCPPMSKGETQAVHAERILAAELSIVARSGLGRGAAESSPQGTSHGCLVVGNAV